MVWGDLTSHLLVLATERGKDWLLEIADQGQFANPHLRPLRRLTWAVLLGVVKGDSPQQWAEELMVQRRAYAAMSIDPGDSGNTGILQMLWNPVKTEKDKMLLDEIWKDVDRTFPECLSTDGSKVLLQRLLFHWCRTCSAATSSSSTDDMSVCYRQGMHELSAVVLLAVLEGEYDGSPEENSLAMSLCGRCYNEADAFLLFSRLMELGMLNMFVPPGFLAVEGDGSTASPTTARCAAINNTLLKAADKDLYHHLQAHRIEPQLYLLRWLRLLYCREFPLEQTLVLWDALFASSWQPWMVPQGMYQCSPGCDAKRATILKEAAAASSAMPLVDYISLALLCSFRTELLAGDRSACLRVLLKGTTKARVNTLVKEAKLMQAGFTYAEVKPHMEQKERERAKEELEKEGTEPPMLKQASTGSHAGHDPTRMAFVTSPNHLSRELSLRVGAAPPQQAQAGSAQADSVSVNPASQDREAVLRIREDLARLNPAMAQLQSQWWVRDGASPGAQPPNQAGASPQLLPVPQFASAGQVQVLCSTNELSHRSKRTSPTSINRSVSMATPATPRQTIPTSLGANGRMVSSAYPRTETPLAMPVRRLATYSHAPTRSQSDYHLGSAYSGMAATANDGSSTLPIGSARSSRYLTPDAIAQSIQREVALAEKSMQRTASAVAVESLMQRTASAVTVETLMSGQHMGAARSASVASLPGYGNAGSDVRRAVSCVPPKPGADRDMAAMIAELAVAGGGYPMPLSTPRRLATGPDIAGADRSMQPGVSSSNLLQTPRAGSVSCLPQMDGGPGSSNLPSAAKVAEAINSPRRLRTGPTPQLVETEVPRAGPSITCSVPTTYSSVADAHGKFTIGAFSAAALPTPSTTCSSVRSMRGDSTIAAITPALTMRTPVSDVRCYPKLSAPRSPAQMFRQLSNTLMTPRSFNTGMLSGRAG